MLKDVFLFLVKEEMNSIPLSEVLDAGKLIGFIEEYGINAELEPLEKVIARNNEENNKSNSRSCD